METTNAPQVMSTCQFVALLRPGLRPEAKALNADARASANAVSWSWYALGCQSIGSIRVFVPAL
jgi:hypothetical protein